MNQHFWPDLLTSLGGFVTSLDNPAAGASVLSNLQNLQRDRKVQAQRQMELMQQRQQRQEEERSKILAGILAQRRQWQQSNALFPGMSGPDPMMDAMQVYPWVRERVGGMQAAAPPSAPPPPMAHPSGVVTQGVAPTTMGQPQAMPTPQSMLAGMPPYQRAQVQGALMQGGAGAAMQKMGELQTPKAPEKLPSDVLRAQWWMGASEEEKQAFIDAEKAKSAGVQVNVGEQWGSIPTGHGILRNPDGSPQIEEGGLPRIGRFPGFRYTAEQEARHAARETGKASLGFFLPMFSNMDNMDMFTMWANVPLTRGREMRQHAERAIEGVLRGSTGAAAPDQERAWFFRAYLPSIWDTDQAKERKVKALTAFYDYIESQEGELIGTDKVARDIAEQFELNDPGDIPSLPKGYRLEFKNGEWVGVNEETGEELLLRPSSGE